MKNKFLQALKTESGDMTVMIAIMMTTLLVISAFVTDIGLAYVNIGKAQDAADAAALSVCSLLPVKVTDSAGVEELYSTVTEYVEKNGFTVSRDDIELSGSGDIYSSIRVTVTAVSKTSFASLIGIDELTGSRSATVGQVKKRSAVFDYCIFSACDSYTLKLGAIHTINGSVFSNGNISISSNRGVITGSAAAGGTVYVDIWNSSVGEKIEGAGHMEMPDFSSVIDSIMPASFSTFCTASEIKAKWWRQTWEGNMMITGGAVTVSNGLDINGNVYVDGDLTVNGPGPFNINGNIYVNGNLKFSNSVKINGAVFATGNIVFNGATTQVDTTEPVCVYSQYGDITIVPGSTTMTGIVYAPCGTVHFEGNNLTFTGSLVGWKVDGMPANLTMYTGSDNKYIPVQSFTGLID